MVEGDITLLLAGVLAHGQVFGDYSFGHGPGGGHARRRGERQRRPTRSGAGRARASASTASTARRVPRLERLTDKFGPALDLHLEVHLRAEVGVVHLLRRRPNALPALPPALVCELLRVGADFGRRRLLLPQRHLQPDRRLPQPRASAAGASSPSASSGSTSPSATGCRRRSRRPTPRRFRSSSRRPKTSFTRSKRRYRNILPATLSRRKEPPKKRGGTEGD